MFFRMIDIIKSYYLLHKSFSRKTRCGHMIVNYFCPLRTHATSSLVLRFLLKALDLFWHEDCLMCGCCGCRLGEVGSTLYTKANMILCKKDYFRYLLANSSHTVWCYYWLTGFTGCLAIRACVPRVSKTYRRSKWSCEPGATSITWSVSRASSAITGTHVVLNITYI